VRIVLVAAIVGVLFAVPAAEASHARWCDTATIQIAGFDYWPYGSEEQRCRTIIRRARAFVIHNKKPQGWKCRRFIGAEGQPYGSCRRGDRYFGVTIPH
jgi:hypothetical protein